jgi:hypothetical protein
MHDHTQGVIKGKTGPRGTNMFVAEQEGFNEFWHILFAFLGFGIIVVFSCLGDSNSVIIYWTYNIKHCIKSREMSGPTHWESKDLDVHFQ